MRFDYKFDLYLIRLSCKGLRQIKLWSARQPPRHPVLCINYEAPCGRRWLLWREANLGMFHLICFEMFLLWEPRSLSLPLVGKQQIYSRNCIKEKHDCPQTHQEQLAPDLHCNRKLYLCSSKVRSGRTDQPDSWLLKTEQADVTTWMKTAVKIRKNIPIFTAKWLFLQLVSLLLND